MFRNFFLLPLISFFFYFIYWEYVVLTATNNESIKKVMQPVDLFNVSPQDRIQDRVFITRLYYLTRPFCSLEETLALTS